MTNETLERRGTTVGTSVLHENGLTYQTMRYKEDGKLLAKGEGVLSTVEDYLKVAEGKDLTKLNTEYEWKDYPRNNDYEVSELGLIRNKKNGKLLHMSLKDKYEEGVKGVWRLRVTIPNVGTQKVSQVVAETYIGERPKGKIVGHNNDRPIDNRASNLTYITSEENKSIDWVLRDIIRKGLNVYQVNRAYDEVVALIEDKYGLGVKVDELDSEDMEEVAPNIDVYKRTVGEIYKFIENGTGVLAGLSITSNGDFEF